MLLAIDTATRLASLALYDGESISAETTWIAHENHTTTLLPEIDRLFALTGHTFDELHALGVSLGPGSFTGLRVGMSVAKGLALTRHIPVVGIPTLDVVAYSQRRLAEKICALIFAGRGRYSAARYKTVGEGVERVTDYFLGRLDELLAWARESSDGLLFSGEVDKALGMTIRGRLPQALIASDSDRLRRAGYLAEMAYNRLAHGTFDDLATLAPIYLPSASVPKIRVHQEIN